MVLESGLIQEREEHYADRAPRPWRFPPRCTTP